MQKTNGTAILNNLGARGTIQSGSNPAISGNTMTGSGGVINSSGTFAFGSSAANMVFNGIDFFINGVSTANASTVTASNIPTSAGTGPLIFFTVTKAGFVSIQTTGSILVLNATRPFDTTEVSFNIVLTLLLSGSPPVGVVTVPITAKLNKYAINAGTGSAYQCDIPFTFVTTTGLAIGTYVLDISRSDLKFANDTGSVWTTDTANVRYTGYNNVFQGKIG
jgi:hypothetical protein